MTIKDKIKSSPKLKKLALWMLMPSGQARPRLWVQWFVNPFFAKKGKGSRIRSRTRMDIMPFNEFILGKNSTIEDFCTVNNGVGKVQIGNNVRIGIGSVLIGPISIGNNTSLGQNVVVTGLNHNYQDISVPIFDQGVNIDPICIDEETWVGANVVILPGISIGKHCVVAAGSIVTEDVPSNSVVAGNPAQIIKQYSTKTGKWERIK